MKDPALGSVAYTCLVSKMCHEIFGPGRNLVRPDNIFGASLPQTVLREAHAFVYVKACVTASETAREMCADENEGLVEKACLYLIDGIILRVVSAMKKEASDERLKHLL